MIEGGYARGYSKPIAQIFRISVGNIFHSCALERVRRIALGYGAILSALNFFLSSGNI